jgi:hypothetical protein
MIGPAGPAELRAFRAMAYPRFVRRRDALFEAVGAAGGGAAGGPWPRTPPASARGCSG